MEIKNEKKIKSHLSKNEVLKRIIDQIPFPKIERTNNFFHDLISCIIEQQIHYRSIKRTFERVLKNAGINELTLTNFYKLEEINFEGTKMSLTKYKTLNAVFELFNSENIDWNTLTNEEIHHKLGNIKGIGKKTIDLLLIYSIGREDIFIPDDYHIEKIMRDLFEIDTSSRVKTQIIEIAKEWSPYQSFAFRYILESKKK